MPAACGSTPPTASASSRTLRLLSETKLRRDSQPVLKTAERFDRRGDVRVAVVRSAHHCCIPRCLLLVVLAMLTFHPRLPAKRIGGNRGFLNDTRRWTPWPPHVVYRLHASPSDRAGRANNSAVVWFRQRRSLFFRAVEGDDRA